MIQAHEEQIADLRRRLEALERTGPRRLGVLYAQAAAMRRQGDELKAEIRAILEAHPGPRRLKAFAVLTMLKRNPSPSLRRVQELITEIKREAGGIAHETPAQIATRAV